MAERWRVGAYELTTLLDREAWLLKVAEPVPYMVSVNLGRVEQEIRQWMERNATG